MQLVLGMRIGADLSAPPAAPAPSGPQAGLLGERSRRILRRIAWSFAFALVVALGVLQGARVAIGAEGMSELAQSASRRAAASPGGEIERDSTRGDLWRPAGSTAQRPDGALQQRRWQPENP